MRVLVTGSSGLIGRWVVRQLIKGGHVAIGLDLAPSPTDGSAEAVVCDTRDRDELVAAVQRTAPDALVHLAARTDLDESEDLEGYAANIQGVRNVVAAIRASRSVKRAIFTSSQLVCRVGFVPSSDTDYCPSTLYGRSKVLTENIVREEDGGGVDWCLVRPTTVWGPGMSLHYQRMLQLIQHGYYFHCGNGMLYKSYSYAGNIAYQYSRLLAAGAEKVHRRTFYLADYEPLSLRTYADGLSRAMGAGKIPTVPLAMARALAWCGDALSMVGWHGVPFNSFRLRNILTEYVFDMTSTEAVCGALPYTAEEGIRATSEWFLSVGGQ